MLENIIKMDQQYYMNTFGLRTPVCFDKGEGVWLYDTDGNKYLDFFAGIAVTALGHAHPALVRAMSDQAAKLLHTSNLYYTEPQAKLAKILCEVSCADKVFFSNSGAEANEGALKLARIYFYKKGQTHKTEIITLKNSFHGRTLATVAATGQPKYQKPYSPLMPGFSHVELGNLAALKAAITPNTAAIMLEAIQGESGVHPCEQEYITAVRQLCDTNDILLIIDEVQTGIGRTGKMFGYQHYGIEPDIFTVAKALGGGVPIGAICAKDAVCAFEPGDHGSTFGGNPLATAAGLAVMQTIANENLVQNAADMGKYFFTSLESLKSKYSCIKEIRAVGLMLGVEFCDGLGAAVKQKLFDAHVLTGLVGDTLRILPPLIITTADVDMFMDVLENVVKAL